MMTHYVRLFAMAVLSFISMYVLMYAMVDRIENVYPNFNQFYMAGLMAAPMVLIEVLLMGEMYNNKMLNIVILIASVVAMMLFFVFIRQQVAIYDRQFLRSMIPHHAGAILMCEKAPVQDPEIQQLCKTIITSQRSEIDQMKKILSRLGGQ
jgi:phosphoglycerol transferase MdoB-like AlkP superfamily enzyme